MVAYMLLPLKIESLYILTLLHKLASYIKYKPKQVQYNMFLTVSLFNTVPEL